LQILARTASPGCRFGRGRTRLSRSAEPGLQIQASVRFRLSIFRSTQAKQARHPPVATNVPALTETEHLSIPMWSMPACPDPHLHPPACPRFQASGLSNGSAARQLGRAVSVVACSATEPSELFFLPGIKACSHGTRAGAVHMDFSELLCLTSACLPLLDGIIMA